MASRKEKINIVTLGCSKNIVDSEQLMHQLVINQFKIVHNSSSSDYKTVIINTCGFINDAKQESVDTILQFVNAKKKGAIRKIFVMGCLSERYKDELKNEIPEVDGFYGVTDLEKILYQLKAEYIKNELNERYLTTPGHYAYLKIAEGCSRNCSFCAIPAIRGSYKSKKIEDIVNEAEILAYKGVKELIVISQDTTYYGIDLYKKQMLAVLLEALIQVKGIEWIRLQYSYPYKFPMEVIELMNKNNKICNYLDIPFQHISNRMLDLMRRGINEEETLKLISDIKVLNPGIALRTTLLVGHPGETEEDFNQLVEFVHKVKFDRLGVFPYSHEEGTFSYYNYTDEAPDNIKHSRAEKIMTIQQKISEKNNESKIGKILQVIIDGKEGDNFIGRTEYDSPEVDGEVIITTYPETIQVGHFYKVEIYGHNEYDLFGRINS